MTKPKPKELHKKSGKPSLYRPEYCDEVIELGKKGLSLAGIGAHFDVAKQTIVDWRNTHPEFAHALTRALTLSQAYWEELGKKGLGDKNFNAHLWLKMVASRFRDDYTDRKEISGPAGGPIETRSTPIDVAAMDPEQRKALRDLILASKGAKG